MQGDLCTVLRVLPRQGKWGKGKKSDRPTLYRQRRRAYSFVRTQITFGKNMKNIMPFTEDQTRLRTLPA